MKIQLGKHLGFGEKSSGEVEALGSDMAPSPDALRARALECERHPGTAANRESAGSRPFLTEIRAPIRDAES